MPAYCSAATGVVCTLSVDDATMTGQCACLRTRSVTLPNRRDAESAPAWRAENDQVRAPGSGVGDDFLGRLADEGLPKLSGGRDAGHAKLKDSCLDHVRGVGVRLDREPASVDGLVKIEVQDAGLACACPARQLCRMSGLACIHDWDEHPPEDLLRARRGVSCRYLLARRPSVR